MRPVLFEFFNIKIYGYGTMISLGIIAAVILLMYKARLKNYDEDKILNMTIFAVIAGVIGGKLFFILSDIKEIIAQPEILKDFGAGFVVYGSIIGGALAVYIYAKKKQWNILEVFDLGIIPVALAQGFGRIGCFLAGCCYGVETHLPIGVTFWDKDCLAPTGVSLIPTQLFSSIFDFALAGFLLWYDRKEHKKGRVFALYMIIYSVGRIIIEFFRNDPRGNVGVLSTSQFIGIFILVAGIIAFNLEAIKSRFFKPKEGRENGEI